MNETRNNETSSCQIYLQVMNLHTNHAMSNLQSTQKFQDMSFLAVVGTDPISSVLVIVESALVFSNVSLAQCPATEEETRQSRVTVRFNLQLGHVHVSIASYQIRRKIVPKSCFSLNSYCCLQSGNQPYRPRRDKHCRKCLLNQDIPFCQDQKYKELGRNRGQGSRRTDRGQSL